MSEQDIPVRSKVEPSGTPILAGRHYVRHDQEDGCATLRAFREERQRAREEAAKPRVSLVKTPKRAAK